MITVNINNRRVEVPEGTTILQAAKKGLLKKSLSNVASAFRHWLQKKYKERLQPVEVAAVL